MPRRNHSGFRAARPDQKFSEELSEASVRFFSAKASTLHRYNRTYYKLPCILLVDVSLIDHRIVIEQSHNMTCTVYPC